MQAIRIIGNTEFYRTQQKLTKSFISIKLFPT